MGCRCRRGLHRMSHLLPSTPFSHHCSLMLSSRPYKQLLTALLNKQLLNRLWWFSVSRKFWFWQCYVKKNLWHPSETRFQISPFMCLIWKHQPQSLYKAIMSGYWRRWELTWMNCKSRRQKTCVSWTIPRHIDVCYRWQNYMLLSALCLKISMWMISQYWI